MSWITDENVDPTLQDWGKAYEELCVLVRTKVPKVKHIDLYYGQEQAIDSDGNWIPFTAPAVFFQFQAAQVDDIGDTSQQLLMDVVVYLCVETVQDSNDRSTGKRRALEFIGMMRELHVALHNAQGDHFSPMSRVALGKVDAPPYMHMYSQTYRCVMLDNSTSKQWAFRDPPLALEIQPITGEPVTPLDPRFAVVRNSDNTYSVEVEGGTEHLLPDVTHTNSDGAPVTLPAMTPFVADLCRVSSEVVNIEDSEGVPVTEVTAPGTYQFPDSLVPFVGADGVTAYLGPVPSNYVGANIRPGTLVPRFRVFLSDGTAPYADRDIIDPNLVLPLVIIKNTANTTVDQVEVNGIGTAPDCILTKPDGTPLNVPSGTPFDIRSLRSGIVYQRGRAHWSGQLFSYQSNDEAAMYAAGFFDVVRPVYPTHFAEIGASFTLLASNNMYGTLNRFTDRNGLQVYGNGIIQDHLTSYEWYYPIVAANNWATAVSSCAALNVGGNTDWRLPPMGVLDSIVNNNGGTLLDYAPYNISISVGLWTSTTTPTAGAQALPLLANGSFQSFNKGTSTLRWVAVRRFL